MREFKGILTFANGTDDIVGTKPAFLYGYRNVQMIHHNWNLLDMNAFSLTLVDVNLNNMGVLTNYRSGANPMHGGAALTNQAFRNLPHWAALDSNTIAVYATMSRLRPTPMQFHFVLRSL
jgi:hypothetical protein